MLLEKIVLNNFRQFYGEQELTFSCNIDRNVTLIHADNGVGKTTLLNALLWCFYKETTAKFENPNEILSHSAKEEDIFDIRVEIYFEHDRQKYLVSRKLNERTKEEEFVAFLIDAGNYQKLPSADVFVRSVVPQEMSKYFFFDGEYAETFSSRNNKGAVKEALESMLGCNTALQALDDLKGLRKNLDKEIAALSKSNMADTFQSQIDKLEEQNSKDEADIIIIQNELDSAETTRREISNGLRNIEGAKEIQQKRDKLEDNKSKAEDKKRKLESQRIKWIDQSSVGLLSDKLIDSAQSIIETANIKGLLPSKIAETFVQDIIEHMNCICHRPFASGSPEEEAIKKLLLEAGSAVVNNRMMSIRTRIGMLQQAKSGALTEFKNITEEIENINSEIQEYELSIRECSTQLQGSNVFEIAEREQALEKIIYQISILTDKRARLKKSCEDRETAISELKGKRDKMLVHNDKAKRIQSKILMLTAAINRLEEELSRYREESRKTIIDKVNKILLETARRDYCAEIDENFNLEMYHANTRVPVAKSSGENQLLSIAFIASLVAFAADRREDSSHLLKPGTMAPLMLDSPFGQLGPSYRNSTAEFLPKLANQVILLVSKSQGDEDVISILDNKIGAEFILISEATGHQGSKPSDILERHGKQYVCSVYDKEKNRTHIQKII